MAKDHYTIRLSDRDILTLIRTRIYTVDCDNGTVYNQKGKPIAPFTDGTYWFVRFYWKGKFRRAISISKVIWMAQTNQTVPKNFEIHHRNENPSDNRFSNLMCLHELDHLKFHEQPVYANEVPF